MEGRDRPLGGGWRLGRALGGFRCQHIVGWYPLSSDLRAAHRSLCSLSYRHSPSFMLRLCAVARITLDDLASRRTGGFIIARGSSHGAAISIMARNASIWPLAAARCRARNIFLKCSLRSTHLCITVNAPWDGDVKRRRCGERRRAKPTQ